jgi:hypothetical protein
LDDGGMKFARKNKSKHESSVWYLPRLQALDFTNHPGAGMKVE